MPATAAPQIRPETHVVRREVNGRSVEERLTVLRGIPGGPPSEEFIILVKPNSQHPEGELYADGEGRMRSWSTERLFAESPMFPDGIPVGMENRHTDTGVGQPFLESSHQQVPQDTLERLRCYAYGEPYLSYTERRKLAKEGERYHMEKAANRQRPETRTPMQALDDLAANRLSPQLEKLIADRVAEEMAKRKTEK